MSRTRRRGTVFFTANPEWANLGQGSPETGEIPGAPPRVTEVPFPSRPPPAIRSCQRRKICAQAVADFYNATYRRGKKSKYTADNVSIASGGRLALTRLASALGNINMGHFIPDYTAYEELLSVFKAFTPIPILLRAESGYKISPADLKEEILGRGLSALLVSNPCNPDRPIDGRQRIAAWCDLARECQCSMIFDEFYSHYIYTNRESANETEDGFRRRICRGRGQRPDYRRGRADEKLALSRLAHQLDARPESRDRSHCQRRFVSRRRREPSVPKRRAAVARSEKRRRRNAGDSKTFWQKARTAFGAA